MIEQNETIEVRVESTEVGPFLLFSGLETRPFLSIFPDGKVIVSGKIYDAARHFWKWVAEIAPPSFSLEREKD